MSSTKDRKEVFKKTVNASSGREKRLEASTSLRKSKRADHLTKRRQHTERQDMSDTEVRQKVTLLPEMVKALLGPDTNANYLAALEIRKLLSIERDPPIDAVIEANAVVPLVKLLEYDQFPKIQFEAAWALTNVASGTERHTRYVAQSGATENFIRLLDSPSMEVKEQVVWALGNIAGDSAELRDFLLSKNVMGPLLNAMQQRSGTSFLRNAAWTLSNLCRGRPHPELKYIQSALPLLAQLTYSVDEEVLTDACWAFSYISDGSPENIQAVVEAGILRRIVELMMHHRASIQTPSLRIVGNIVTGTEEQTDAAIQVGALTVLGTLMSHEKKTVRKESCWTISNVAAGSCAQIQSLIEANLVPLLVYAMEKDQFDVRREAAWATSNATSGGTHEQVSFLVSQGCIKPLCDLLEADDVKLVQVVLEGLRHILKIGAEIARSQDGENKYALYVEEAGGVDKLEELQKHKNNAIFQSAGSLIDDFFGDDADLMREDSEMAPYSEDNGFKFGME